MADQALVRAVARRGAGRRPAGGEIKQTLEVARSLVQWLAILVGLVAVVGVLSTLAR